MLKKKPALTLTVSDIFASGKDKRELNSIYLDQTAVGRNDVRTFYIGITYRFGRTQKEPEEERLQFDNGN